MAPDELAQGTLELLWELQDWLAEISGMRAVSLQPAAGAQGELTGILMVRAYHLAAVTWSGPRSSSPTRPTARTPRPPRWPGSGRHVPSARDGGVDVERFRQRAGAAHGGDDDHQPFDPRPVRERGSVSCSMPSTRREPWPTWTAPTSTRSSGGSSPAKPASSHALSTPTRPSRPLMAAAALGRACRGRGEARRHSCPRPGSCVMRTARSGWNVRRAADVDRAGPVIVGIPACWFEPRPTCARMVGPAFGGQRGRGPRSELSKHQVAATYEIPFQRPCKHEFIASAATSGRRQGSARSTSPSASSTTASTRRRSTSR